MGRFDDFLAAISPRWACTRLQWRAAFDEMTRSYDAGKVGRGNTHWHATNRAAEQEDRYDRDRVRARARDLERNSDILNANLLAFRRNVIGRGFTLRPATGDGELDEALAELWKQWCKARNCDVTGQQNLTEILRTLITRKKVDGGILLVKCYTEGGVVPFCVQMLEVDELDSMAQVPKKSGNRIVGGIEYDRYNRPAYYHIRQYDLDGYQTTNSIVLSAKDVIFYYTKRRPSQIREMSDLAPVLGRVRDANELITAASVRSRILACFGIAIKRVTNAVGGMGRNNRMTESRETYQGKTLSPGMILEMNPGDEAQAIDPHGGSDDAGSMLKTLHRQIGAGLGLSYEASSRDMSQTNYSSARQGLIEDNETYAEEIDHITEILDELYESFVISAVLSGAVNIPDFWNKKSVYFAHQWARAPKAWIDPLKEANANKIAVQTGQKTFQQIAAENGTDWKTQIEEMADVVKYARELGFEIGGVIYGNDIDPKTAEPQ